jgi:hypothetical protein
VLFDAVRRFVALSGQVGVKGSDFEVKELMVFLRRSGFSSSQIKELSGGKWSDTLVRQYTTGWGEVDENLDKQRNGLMTTLRELASSGKDIKDVEHVLILDRSVRARGFNSRGSGRAELKPQEPGSAARGDWEARHIVEGTYREVSHSRHGTRLDYD